VKRTIYLLLFLLLSLVPLSADSLRIKAQSLSSELNNYKVLDTRSPELYKKGHIKGALNFPIILTYEHKKINGKISQPNKMQKTIRDLGLHSDDAIVIYDDGTFFDAARLFWTLEVYSFSNVKLLNMGYDSWEIAGYAVSTIATKVKKSNYIAQINNKRLATKFTTQLAIRNPNQVIIDARNYNSYIGKQSRAKRYGHIPKAINIPATHNINYDDSVRKLKSIKNLKDTYKSINKNQKVVLYCTIGKISATNYFAMRELGYNVSNYDASWKEWGNDFNLPIVNPSKE